MGGGGAYSIWMYWGKISQLIYAFMTHIDGPMVMCGDGPCPIYLCQATIRWAQKEQKLKIPLFSHKWPI